MPGNTPSSLRAVRHGRVYAFEPGSYARSILGAVVWLHRLSNVTVLPVALGSEARLDTLTIPLKGGFGFGLSHLGAPSARWHAIAQEIAVLTTIDMAVGTLGLDRLDFIKADIEGWELRLLHGAEDTLERFRPRPLLELSGTALARAGDSLDEAFAFLAARGYRAYRFERKANLVPISGPADGDFWFIPDGDSAALATTDISVVSSSREAQACASGTAAVVDRKGVRGWRIFSVSA